MTKKLIQQNGEKICKTLILLAFLLLDVEIIMHRFTLYSTIKSNDMYLLEHVTQKVVSP